MSASEKLCDLVLEAETEWYDHGEGDKHKFIANYLKERVSLLGGTMTDKAAPTAAEKFVEEFNSMDKDLRELHAALILGI